MDDDGSSRQVQAGTAGLERKDHRRRTILGLEVFHHLVALIFAHPAVEEGYLPAELIAKVWLQDIAKGLVLGKDQEALAGFSGLVHDAHEFFNLAGAMLTLDRHRRAIAQVMRGVITNLLDTGERGQHQPALIHSRSFLQVFFHLVDQCFIQGSLLGGHGNGKDLLGLFWQIIDNIRIRLHAAKDKRRGELAQAFRHLFVIIALDGLSKVIAEERGGAQYSGITKVQDGAHL